MVLKQILFGGTLEDKLKPYQQMPPEFVRNLLLGISTAKLVENDQVRMHVFNPNTNNFVALDIPLATYRELPRSYFKTPFLINQLTIIARLLKQQAAESSRKFDAFPLLAEVEDVYGSQEDQETARNERVARLLQLSYEDNQMTLSPNHNPVGQPDFISLDDVQAYLRSQPGNGQYVTELKLPSGTATTPNQGKIHLVSPSIGIYPTGRLYLNMAPQRALNDSDLEEYLHPIDPRQEVFGFWVDPTKRSIELGYVNTYSGKFYPGIGITLDKQWSNPGEGKFYLNLSSAPDLVD